MKIWYYWGKPAGARGLPGVRWYYLNEYVEDDPSVYEWYHVWIVNQYYPDYIPIIAALYNHATRRYERYEHLIW